MEGEEVPMETTGGGSAPSKQVSFEVPRTDSSVGNGGESKATTASANNLDRGASTKKSFRQQQQQQGGDKERELGRGRSSQLLVRGTSVTNDLVLGEGTNATVGALFAMAGAPAETITVKAAGDHVDLATGTTTTRFQTVQTVSADDQVAMKNHMLRRRFASSRRHNKSGFVGGANESSMQDSSSHRPGEQITVPDGSGEDKNDDMKGKGGESLKRYRIISQTAAEPLSRLRKFIQQDEEFLRSWLTSYLRWTFEASLFQVILVSFLWFMLLTIEFAVLVIWIDRMQPQCIVGFSRNNPDDNLNFVDAYHLSWTTLSTVGYGLISPGEPMTTDTGSKCHGISILMAFESFVGVLFASITGAIVFGKIARIQSIAPVRFSSPVVVRYGSGCVNRLVDYSDSAMQDTSEKDHTDDLDAEIPCPILEFRLINTMWNQKGGEIMDAAVSLVLSRLASASESVAKDQIREKRKRKSRGRKSKAPPSSSSSAAAAALNGEKSSPHNKNRMSLTTATRSAVAASGSVFQRLNHGVVSSASAAAHAFIPSHSHDKNKDEEDEPYNLAQLEALKMMQQQAPAVVAVDEGGMDDEDDTLVPRSIFQPLEVQTDRHPFFRRVWTIRHVCDENSPLLPIRVRKKIQANNGFWPQQLNRAEEVRKALNFHEIIVSFSGTANASGSAVFAQKVYSYVDMVVGYTFANILSKDTDGKLILAEPLLNDVRPQKGGGEEPIQTQDTPTFTGYTNNNVTDSMSVGSENVTTSASMEDEDSVKSGENDGLEADEYDDDREEEEREEKKEM